MGRVIYGGPSLCGRGWGTLRVTREQQTAAVSQQDGFIRRWSSRSSAFRVQGSVLSGFSSGVKLAVLTTLLVACCCHGSPPTLCSAPRLVSWLPRTV